MSHLNYLHNPYEDNFKELCAAMPIFYLDVFEMREILKAQGRLLDDVSDGFELTLANNFILPADESTISMWEKAIGIRYEEALTLDQRKQAVIAKIIGYGHIGEPEIRAIIACYTDATVNIAFSRGVIYLEIYDYVLARSTLLATLLSRIPAHLRLRTNFITVTEFESALALAPGMGYAVTITHMPELERAIDWTADVGSGSAVHTIMTTPIGAVAQG